MRRYPKSKLQLLDPAKKEKQDSTARGEHSELEQSYYSSDHVKMQMKYYGVFRPGSSRADANGRLEIVPRLSKEGHIKR